MADHDTAVTSILEEIVRLNENQVGSFGSRAAAIRNLAEAWAWLTAPAQPHGSAADAS